MTLIELYHPWKILVYKFNKFSKFSFRSYPILVLIITSLVAQGIAFLSISITSRVYSPDQFAIFSIYTSLFTVTLSVSSLKLDQAVIFSKSHFRTNILIALALRIPILICLISSLIFIFAISAKYRFDLKYFLLVGISFYIASVFQVGVAIRTNTEDFNRLSRDRFLQTSSTSVFQILLSTLPLHSLGLVAGDMFGRFSGVLSLHTVLKLRRYKYIPWKFTKYFLLKNRNYTFILSIASLIGALAQQLPFFMIPVMNSSKDAAAYFLISRIITAPLSLLASSASQVYYGGLSRLRPDEIKNKYIKNLKSILFISTIFCLLLILFREYFVNLIIGTNWSPESSLMIPLCISAIFWTPASSLSGTLVMAGRQNTTLKLAIFEVASKFLSIYVLAKLPFIFTAYAISAVSLMLYVTTIFRSSGSIGIDPITTIKTIMTTMLPPALFVFCIYLLSDLV
ncbi:oligosaccharide flippase family protein [Deinococcus rubellus]|uniref:oligosaccharide flippase family protein n=1 Tax=Deinococcus rubellus TaxID=1889240 RepID=UPI0035E43D79